MKLILKRKTEINSTVLGELFINNKFFCYTLEDKIREVKIKHETCIPEGIYKVILTLSQRFKVVLPLLLNVPNFAGIRIHAGSTIASTSGCIIVGSSILGERLLHSKTTLEQLMIRLKQALRNKEEVTIEVINPIKAKEIIPIRTQEEIMKKEIVLDSIVIEPIIQPKVEIQSQTNNKLKTLIQWLKILIRFISKNW